jgi:hypothetical protein
MFPHSLLFSFLRVVFLEHCSLGDANDPSAEHLRRLEGSLAWEARSLHFAVVGVTAATIYEPMGLAMGGIGIFVITAMVRTCFHLSFFVHSV